MVNWSKGASGNMFIILPLVTISVMENKDTGMWAFRIDNATGNELFTSKYEHSIYDACSGGVRKAAELCEEQAVTIRRRML